MLRLLAIIGMLCIASAAQAQAQAQAQQQQKQQTKDDSARINQCAQKCAQRVQGTRAIYSESGHVKCTRRCPLSANSGHRLTLFNHLVSTGDK